MQHLIPWDGKNRILIADDEPDVHAVTKLSLKGLSRKSGSMEFLSAFSGKETLDALRKHPDIGVILLDVVMENDSAGLDACKAIRGELKNPLVRILLRTGQPGVAPEQQTIDTYDIDGYLPKADISSSRLYTAVRCAFKSYQELVALERHRAYLTAVHECAMSLSATLTVDQILRPILETVLAICPAPLVALQLETFEHAWGPRHLFLYLSSEAEPARGAAAAEEARVRVQRAAAASQVRSAGVVANGFLIPLLLHHELGHGWIFVDGITPDDLVQKTLIILAAHAQNAIYSSIALAASRERKGLVFEEATI